MLVAVLAAAGGARGAPAGAAESVELAQHLQYLADPGGQWGLAAVQARSGQFRPWQGPGAFNRGYSDAVYWLRFPARVLPRKHARVLLELGYFSLEHVKLFAPDGDRWVAGLQERRVGAFWPHRYPVFKLSPDRETGYYYLRVASRGSLTVPLTLWEPAAFAARTQQRYFLQTLYFGELGALILFNFLLFLAVRDSRYVLYVLYAGFLGVGMLSLQGLGGQFLWPNTAFWSTMTANVGFSLAGVFALVFTQRFLDTRRYTPGLHVALAVCAGLLAINAALPTLGFVQLSSRVLSASAAPITIVIFVAAGLAYRRGSRGARFFLLAWAVLLVSSGIAGLRNLGWVPTNAVTSASLAVGSALEMILLSLALADRINQERSARVEAQRRAAETQQKLADAEAAAARRLERQVAERTQALRRALEHQQATLTQYVRFGAFLAHELRNPLGIIQNQAALAQKEAERTGASSPGRLDSIAAAAARLKVLFDEWLASDRLQQTGIVPVARPLALGPWLAEWLPIAAAGHPAHEVELHEDCSLATVAADDSLLRIVLFNLIDNACKYAPVEAPVTVAVEAARGYGGFSVSDRGPGMDESTQARVFDGYTRLENTESDTGVGLGLALVKRIVERHDGTIALASAPGQGSRFTIWLPLAEQGDAAATAEA